MDVNDQTVAAVQAVVVASINALRVTLLGADFAAVEASPISDDEVAEMLRELLMQPYGECYVASCGDCGENFSFDTRDDRLAWLDAHSPKHISTVSFFRCGHESLSGDEGPISESGRMPARWRCDECGIQMTR